MSNELQELGAYTEDQLLLRLAEQMTAGGAPLDPSHKRAVGRALFSGWFAKLRDILCSGAIPIDGSSSTESLARDAAAIMDAIAAFKNQLPLATFSMLVAKYGLAALCSES